MGLTSSYTSFEEAKFVVVPVPYDSTVSYRPGSRDGPYSVIEASRYLELFDLELELEPFEKGVFTIEEIDPVRSDAAKTIDKLRMITEGLIKEDKIPILIGGEHTITLGSVGALPNDVIVVDLDAHADLRDEYLGDFICHACVMRRIHETERRILEVGVRSMSIEEFMYVKKMDVPIFYRESIRKRGNEEVLKSILNIVEGERVYLSIDMDVLDPSEAPGVSTPEPDGLKFWEVKEIIKKVCQSSEVMGVDLVEVSPIPGNTVTEFLAASLLYRTIGFIG